MAGNITKDGISKDLAWMCRIGIGGVHIFDAALETPQIVDRRLSYMSDEWKDAFRHATEIAGRAGMEVAVAASAGWSETGGPWVTSSDAMKKVVWESRDITGPASDPLFVPRPSSTIGPFQDTHAVHTPIASNAAVPPTEHYDDAIVLAYRLPDASNAADPIVSVGGQPVDASVLWDGSYQTALPVPRFSGQVPGSIELDYPTPQTIRAATIALETLGRPYRLADVAPELQAYDGTAWVSLGSFAMVNGIPTTIAFAPTAAERFRILLHTQEVEDLRGRFGSAPGAVVQALANAALTETIPVRAISLHREDRIDRFETKAGFSMTEDYYSLDRQIPSLEAVRPADVLNLTDQLNEDDSIDWKAPEGHWRIVRIGYSITGTTNHPAVPEATGLEVDKYDGEAVHRYIEEYLRRFENAVKPGVFGDGGLSHLMVDSIEAGLANWTPKFIEQFKRLRGYNPRPWLLAVTGILIGSREESDRFLFDFRRTLADLIAVEHYGTIAKVAHDRGLKVYGEALEVNRPCLGDDMSMRQFTDVPMAAIWTWPEGQSIVQTLLMDMKGASSVAHIYGQNLAATESLTSCNAPWAFSPAQLKMYIDLAFACGINRPIIHSSVHQPVDDKVPGLSLSVFGQHFSRHETWAEMAGPWMDYLARSAFLLQHGSFVADVAYFYGEEAPLTALFGRQPVKDAPSENGYDFVSADAVLDVLTVSDGLIRARGETTYRLLFLGGSSRKMSVRMLRRLKELALLGAVVAGPPPTETPGLVDNPSEFEALVAELWGPAASTSIGKGRVINCSTADAALEAAGVPGDFSVHSTKGHEILFVHRRSESADVYFVTNRADQDCRVDLEFGVAGKRPQIWRAETAAVSETGYHATGSATIVPTTLKAHESFFVVFTDRTDVSARDTEKTEWQECLDLSTDWNVAFQTGRGAPAERKFDKLTALNAVEEPGVRYFSGVATYRRVFEVSSDAVPGRFALNLGAVGDIAEVFLNNERIGAAWTAPFSVELGEKVNAGRNILEIRVANRWINRLIGDAQPNVTPITFTSLPTYRPDAPLRPAGLIGPVKLLVAAKSR
jgi:hypothetical protein